MFSSPILVKGSKFHSPVLGKGSIGSRFQRFLVPQTSAREKFYRFLRPVLGKGLCSPVNFCEIILDFPVHAELGKGSISSQVQYWEKVL